MDIKGYYLDGKTSQQHSAVLKSDPINKTMFKLLVEKTKTSEDASAVIEVDYEDRTVTKLIAYKDIKISSRLGNTPREISFDNSQLFITNDNKSIDQLNDMSGEKNSIVHLLESKMSSVIFASIFTILVMWGTVEYGIPEAAKIIANKMPTSLSEQFGSTLDVLDETVFEPSELSDKEQQRIRELASPFLQQHNDLKPKLNFRSGMKANALALPNGDIVFTDDFVELVENDQQLLAVLFHELGHLKHRHLARRVLQDSMITLIVILISGDVDTIDILTGIPTLILDLSYSRTFEVEADTYALELLHQSNIPLESFSSVMQLLDSYYHNEIEDDDFNADIPNFLMTHPATKDRILMTEQFKKQLNE